MASESVKPESPDDLLDAGTTPTSFETGVREKPEIGIIDGTAENTPEALVLDFKLNTEKILKPRFIGKPSISDLELGIRPEEEGTVTIPDDLTG